MRCLSYRSLPRTAGRRSCMTSRMRGRGRLFRRTFARRGFAWRLPQTVAGTACAEIVRMCGTMQDEIGLVQLL